MSAREKDTQYDDPLSSVLLDKLIIGKLKSAYSKSRFLVIPDSAKLYFSVLKIARYIPVVIHR